MVTPSTTHHTQNVHPTTLAKKYKPSISAKVILAVRNATTIASKLSQRTLVRARFTRDGTWSFLINSNARSIRKSNAAVTATRRTRKRTTHIWCR